MKISELIEILEYSKVRLGDVEVYAWEGLNKESFIINTVNNEGDHVELTK